MDNERTNGSTGLIPVEFEHQLMGGGRITDDEVLRQSAMVSVAFQFEAVDASTTGFKTRIAQRQEFIFYSMGGDVLTGLRLPPRSREESSGCITIHQDAGDLVADMTAILGWTQEAQTVRYCTRLQEYEFILNEKSTTDRSVREVRIEVIGVRKVQGAARALNNTDLAGYLQFSPQMKNSMEFRGNDVVVTLCDGNYHRGTIAAFCAVALGFQLRICITMTQVGAFAKRVKRREEARRQSASSTSFRLLKSPRQSEQRQPEQRQPEQRPAMGIIATIYWYIKRLLRRLFH